jgi:hypothetical protein
MIDDQYYASNVKYIQNEVSNAYGSLINLDMCSRVRATLIAAASNDVDCVDLISADGLIFKSLNQCFAACKCC